MLGSVQQDGDMGGRQSEHRSHVFTGGLVEHPQGNDRTLQLPEMIQASDHERKTLSLDDQFVDRLYVSGEKGKGLVAGIMWACDLVPAASIPRVVANQNREQLDRIRVRFNQLSGLRQQEEGMERVLNRIECVLFSQPFSSGNAIELATVRMHEASDPFKKPGSGFPRCSDTAFRSRHSPGDGHRLGHPNT